MDRPGVRRALVVAGGLAATATIGALVYRALAQRRARADANHHQQEKATNQNDASTTANASSSSSSSSSTSAAPSASGRRKFVIGTRSSQLALWQAHHVQELLSKQYPHLEFEVLPMNTMGDIDQIKPLSDFGSKGVFTKELDQATMRGQIQLAVHCMKDLPTTLPAGLFMGAVLPRGDTEDVLVLPASHPKAHKGGFEDLPPGSVIGTSAMRRSAAVAKYYPHLKCENIRGNVNTRLAKLDRGEYAALLLARVGLMRLGLANRISQTLDVKKFGYAVGQGALAIVCKEDDRETQQLLAALDDVETRWACEAERGVLRTLQGGCKVPITIRTTIDNPSKRYLEEHAHSSSTTGVARTLHLWCSVMSLDGSVDVHATHSDTCDSTDAQGCGPEVALEKARHLGEALGQKLLHKGADKLLEGIIDREGTGLQAPAKK